MDPLSFAKKKWQLDSNCVGGPWFWTIAIAETQLIDWNNQITECVWLLCLDGLHHHHHHHHQQLHTSFFILFTRLPMSWRSPHYWCENPKGSPKSHPIEIHYLSCLSVHTVQTPHSFQKVWIQKSTQLFLQTLPMESDTNNNNCHHNNDNIQPQGQQQQQ